MCDPISTLIGYRLPAAILIAAVVNATSLPSAKASFLGGLGGIITDPLGLQRSSSEVSAALDRTMLQLQQLEAQGNYDATERIAQIQNVANEALSGIKALEDKAIDDANKLEKQVNSDAIRLIYDFQCTTDVIFNGQLQGSFASLLNTLGASDISGKIFGIKIFDIGTKKVAITKPDQAYWSTKSAIMGQLEANTKEDSPASNIVSTYQNLELAAKPTACFYRGQVYESDLITEANNMEIMSLEWTSAVSPAHP